jgi:hypothetical protein
MANDNGNPFTDESLTNHPSVEAQPADGNPFSDPALTSPEYAQQQNAGGPSQEEQQFLQSTPGYKYVPADTKFPNRPAGVYPSGPGNEWRNDPSYSQSPVDLHMVGNTAQGAATAAAATAAPLVAGAAPSIVDAAISHLGGLTQIVEAARKLGWTTFGLKEAHDLYKMVAGDSKGK